MRQPIGHRGKLRERHEEEEADNQKKKKTNHTCQHFIKAKLWGLIK